MDKKRKTPVVRDLVDVKSGAKYDVGLGAPKNKFSAKWLSESEKDALGDSYMLYIRKHRENGFAWCEYCQTSVNYSTTGKKALFQHSSTTSHSALRKEKLETNLLPAAFRATESKIKCDRPGVGSYEPSLPPKPVSLSDRVSHQEGLICSFLAEHSLPLSLSVSADLIKLSRELSNDNAALQKLEMQRTSTAYKLKYGLAEVEHKRLVKDLKTKPFSLNLDESTSKGNKKHILNVLACFFSEELQKSVTYLYCALELTVVSGETVFNAVMERIRLDEIPLTNLVSLLTDSAAYMRGVHRGFYTRMKEVAPHLLDIDGDVCHHIHNISKMFSSTLDTSNILSKLLDDIYRDFDLSADLKQDLLDICELLDVPALLPYQRASHRWMSLLDASQRFLDLLKPLTIFYFAWLSVSDKKTHQKVAESILTGVSKANRAQVFLILTRLKGKGLTTLGRARKSRITAKLFSQRDNVLIHATTVTAIFPKFKSFILLFQQDAPQIHLVHDKVYNLLKNFLGCFMKHEVLYDHTNLNKVDPMRKENTLALNDIFCSCETRKLLDKDKSVKNVFLKQLLVAYQTTAKYMQQKLPHRNAVLKHLSSLDPELHGHSAAVQGLRALCEHFPTLIKDDQKDAFITSANALNLTTISTEETALDKWWNNALQKEEFSVMKPVIHACLSIFTGPKVESSFSLMNNIITATSNRMNVDTYEAFLKQKYWLLAQNKSSTEAYHRQDPVYSPVDKSLIYHLQTASSKAKSVKAKKNRPLILNNFTIPKKRPLPEEVKETSTSKRPRPCKSPEPIISQPPLPNQPLVPTELPTAVPDQTRAPPSAKKVRDIRSFFSKQ